MQERIRNYLQKYLPAIGLEPSAWQTLEGQPGTPRHNRSRQAFLASHLDVRPRKPPEPEPEPELIAPVDSMARGRTR